MNFTDLFVLSWFIEKLHCDDDLEIKCKTVVGQYLASHNIYGPGMGFGFLQKYCHLIKSIVILVPP